MSSNLRAGVGGAAALAVVVLAAWLGGLLGESAEDQVNAVADDFRGELSPAKLEAALAHIDPTVAPVEVSSPGFAGGGGFTRVYGNGAVSDLRRDASRALGPLMGESFRELSRSVEIADDERAATTRSQLLSTRQGTVSVELTLVRDGERWLVRRVGVTR